jgi:hypothetical protein
MDTSFFPYPLILLQGANLRNEMANLTTFRFNCLTKQILLPFWNQAGSLGNGKFHSWVLTK